MLAEVEAGRFLRFDQAGALLQERAPRAFSLEHDLYRWSYEVRGDELVERTVIEGRESTRSSERVELSGLRELGPEEEPRPALIQAWRERLADAARAAEAARSAEADQLAARAGEPLPLLSEARRLLAERITRYRDDTAAGLLALLDLAAALPREDLSEALQAELAGAARLACFRGTPEDRALSLHPYDQAPGSGSGSGPGSGPGSGSGPELLTALERMIRELLAEADVQERVDANRNAAAYQRAATRLARAARLLAGTEPA